MSAENTPIPRFVVPDTYSLDQYTNYRAFRSPEDGNIVQIRDDLWQAARIEEWMFADGERLILKDFQAAALDPSTYPEYIGRPNGHDLRMNMAGLAFNAVLTPIISEAVAEGWDIVAANPDAYQINPYRPYASWAKDQWRRYQYLVSTERAFNTYEGFKHHENPAKRRLKFLRTFDVLFDAEPPEELVLPREEDIDG